MYHGIVDGRRASHPYHETNTSPAVFLRQLRELQECGYKSVTLDEAIQVLCGKGAPERLVVITFDDGFRDFYTHAMPALQESGFGATMFVVSGFPEVTQTRLGAREFMTWSEIREISRNGIQVGSHTVNHPQLHRLATAAIEQEIRVSKQSIEDKLGMAVSSFSYPYAFPEQDGKFVARLRDTLKGAGYQNGVSTILGRAHQDCDSYFLPRLPVNDYDDTSLFRAKLEGSYDWTHIPQIISKVVKSRSRRAKAIAGFAASAEVTEP